jgi:hypothetical protein
VLDELIALGALDGGEALAVGRRVLGGNAAAICGLPWPYTGRGKDLYLVKGRLAAFEAKSGSGYVLITFKRARRPERH